MENTDVSGCESCHSACMFIALCLLQRFSQICLFLGVIKNNNISVHGHVTVTPPPSRCVYFATACSPPASTLFPPPAAPPAARYLVSVPSVQLDRCFGHFHGVLKRLHSAVRSGRCHGCSPPEITDSTAEVNEVESGHNKSLTHTLLLLIYRVRYKTRLNGERDETNNDPFGVSAV